MCTSLILVLLVAGVTVPGILSKSMHFPGQFSHDTVCYGGNGVYFPGQKWPGPPGTCETNQCMKLIDGIAGVTTQDCGVYKIQGQNPHGSCKLTQDFQKKFPDCCPSFVCTRTNN